MIKQTFYNLPEEKRNRIIKAIVHEFSNSSAEKVSINRIVKTANISRGSFYQYFDDKLDLVEVFIKSIVDLSAKGINDALEKSDGNIFYTYEKLFDIIANFANDSTQRVIIKNLARGIKANDNLISEYLFNRFESSEIVGEMYKLFNTDNLKFQSVADVKNLSQILTQLLKNAIFNYFVVGESYNDVKHSYLRKIFIIKCCAEA